MDTSNSQIVNITDLVALYKLSKAEEVISKLLVEGRTNHEIAEIRIVSIETIRLRVKSIF